MSAYIVSPRTIKAMVQYLGQNLMTYHKMTKDEAAELLYDENRKSVSARYDEKESTTEKGEFLRAVVGKGWEYLAFSDGSAVDMIKVARCYQYQTCEHDGHENSKAWKLSEAVIDEAIHNLPGWGKAPWGLDDEEPKEVISLAELAKKVRAEYIEKRKKK